MTDFPLMVFKSGGPYGRGRKAYSVGCARDAGELDKMLSRGWRKTKAEALGEKPAKEPEKELEPTRAELEQKADELGIRHDKRMKDETITARIEEALS